MINHLLSCLWVALTLYQEISSRLEANILAEDVFNPTESIQVFKPLDSDFHFILEPNTVKNTITVSLLGNNDQVELKRQQMDQIKAIPVSFWDTTNQDHLKLLVLLFYNVGNPFSEDSQIVLISEAIRVLNGHNLSHIQRIYWLTFLWVHQDYLLSRNSQFFIRQMQSGELSRAGLELYLVKGFDLILEHQKALEHPDSWKSINPLLLGVLQRVELLNQMQRDFGPTGKLKPSKRLQMIHDDLLQASFPISDELSGSITRNFIQGIIEKEALKDELKHFFRILRPLSQNNKVSKTIIEMHCSQDFSFKTNFEDIINWDNIRIEIEQYCSDHGVDPYIASLLIPFLELPPVTLDHYEYIVCSFREQEHAVVSVQVQSKAEVNLSTASQSESQELVEMLPVEMSVETDGSIAPGSKYQDPEDEKLELNIYMPTGRKQEQYIKDQEFVLKLMYEASSHVKNSKEYLDKNLKWIDDHYELKDIIDSRKEHFTKDICSICQYHFSPGQRVVQLDCVKHIYHKICMQRMLNGRKKRFQCPLCRAPIQVPISIKQHVFWHKGLSSDNDGSTGFVKNKKEIVIES